MPMELQDGLGRGFRAAINEDQHLEVDSITRQRISFISAKNGLAFSLNSHDASAAAGNAVCYLQNTSTTRDLVVSSVRVGGVNTALWKLWFVTGTSAGTALTPTNQNRASGNVAEATARGDGAVTGLTLSAQIGNVRTAANNHGLINLEQSVVLGTNDAIAVEYDTGTTGIAEVFVRFFYEAR